MTPTPVGMRCPECSTQRTQVRTMRSTTSEPRVTIVLIVACVVLFLATNGFSGGSGKLWTELYLDGFDVHVGHDYWRLVTSGFLHSGPIHILFNMYLLWLLGNLMEPTLGSGRFTALYITALLWGAFGALLLQHPFDSTVGASGAVFGLMGATILAMRARGIDPWQSGLGVTLLLNLGITFLIPGIAIGGHIGGLIAGGLAGYLLFDVAPRRRASETPVLAVCVVLAVALAVGCIALARSATGV
jgi:membrane associated rhomboid family serine protease